ncbi:MAG: VacJ family lipoprotein [Methylococcales bacterium]|nr:VacJ family lipoprotein [Methylococcales bacterium]
MCKKNKLLTSIIFAMTLNGCATIEKANPDDPWESWNRPVHDFNDDLDDYVLKPVAKGYRWITPDFVDQSISNIFSNIDDIGVTINDILQGKILQSGLDASRFLVNSTAGLGGIIDIATMIDLPKHNEDFGQTLGFWGIPTGPYLVLPFFGPSSPRGVGGLMGDAAFNPISYIGLPIVSAATFATEKVDLRADNLGTGNIAEEAAAFGKYEFYRDAYISKRKTLIADGAIDEEEEASWSLDLDENFDDLEPLDQL